MDWEGNASNVGGAMRKLISMLAILILAGCQGVVGPVENFRDNRQRPPGLDTRWPDGTPLTDEEQQVQSRQRYPYLYEDNRMYAPNSFTDRPGLMGR